MKIASVEAIPIAASFKKTFRFGTTDRVDFTQCGCHPAHRRWGVGYGEACPVPAFTSETQVSILELIETRVAPALLGKNPENRGQLLHDVSKVLKFAPFTIAAVDTALLDLLGRALGVGVSTLLGGSYRDRTEVHGSVGWDEDPGKVVETALEQATTYRSLKTYAGRGDVDDDLDKLQAVRDAVGPDIMLFVDINGMWTPSDLIRALPRVREIGLTMLEQPLPRQASGFIQQLVELRVDICADESVRTVDDAATVVRDRTATVINLGHSKLGGPSAAMHAAQIALGAGVDLMVGSVLEMGIATAMGLHLAAALPRLSYPSYLMGPLKYRQQLTDEQVKVVDSHIAIPQGPGLGITVDSPIHRPEMMI